MPLSICGQGKHCPISMTKRPPGSHCSSNDAHQHVWASVVRSKENRKDAGITSSADIIVDSYNVLILCRRRPTMAFSIHPVSLDGNEDDLIPDCESL